MKDKILRIIYRRFAAKFNDFLVEDYIKSVPEQTTSQALEVIQIHKRKLQRLTDYLAFQLHRKMANDVRNSERYQGMFVQLKIIDQLVRTRPQAEHELNEQPVAEKEPTIDYEDQIAKASAFASKARNTQ